MDFTPISRIFLLKKHRNYKFLAKFGFFGKQTRHHTTRFAAMVANFVLVPAAAPPFADAAIHGGFSPVGALTSVRIYLKIFRDLCFKIKKARH